MNKTFKKVITCGTCLAMAGVMLAGCGGNKNKVHAYDTETRPLVLSIGDPDLNFNPLFYTSQNDGEIIGMTQLSMLSTDKNANPKYGDNEATVVKDLTQEYSAAKNTTTYRFVIKNGIKFSDGEPLTIKDVLFNMYVLLDPQYTGSATMYSVNIQGLKAYRAQDPSLSDSSTADYNTKFVTAARTRIDNLLDYDENSTANPLTDDILKDIYTINGLFREELTTLWNTYSGTLDSYKNEYRFTKDWELYYFSTGLVSYVREMTTTGEKRKKDENGKYLTTLDEDDTYKTNIEAAANDAAKIAEYKEKYDCNDETAKEYIMRDYAIDTVYASYFNPNNTRPYPAGENATDEEKNAVVEMPFSGQLTEILLGSDTANTAMTQFINDERTKFYSGLGDELRVKTISGITTEKASTFNGKNLGAEHDILQIVINGQDPAAIWNFGFAVTPMHYYSGTYEGVDYVKLAMDTDPNSDTVSNHFGVKLGVQGFFKNVLNAPQKASVPVGAGPYQVSDENYGDGSPTTFYKGNVAYYKRNENFHTVGSGIDNAKIKYLRYMVVKDDRIISSLQGEAIDYGTPNCTPDNVKKVGELKNFGNVKYYNNGYGYVGVNPKSVPNVYVRRAIMKAMNLADIMRYYDGLAVEIYKPTSTASWVYTDGGGTTWKRYDSLSFTTKKDDIEALLRQGGCTKDSEGKYTDPVSEKPLKYTFTIAGGSDDHPAYDMFTNAAAFLNECGFEITVTQDVSALQKLATGSLQVWAAAWSSGIDPDMYQVWHKDSKATSVKNWGYDAIVGSTGSKYSYERGIIDTLSETIMKARSTLTKELRIEQYLKAYDLVLDLAVEFPTYQRQDLAVYNRVVIDLKTLNQNASAFEGVLDKIWEVDYN